MDKITTVGNVMDVYGDEFQISTLKVIMNSVQVFKAVREHLDAEFFTFEIARNLYELINDYYKTNEKIPEYSTLEILVRGKFHSSNQVFLRDACLKFVLKMRSQQKMRDEEFVIQRIINFCKRQAAIKAANQSIDLIRKYSSDVDVEPDFSPIYSAFDNVLKISLQKIDSEMLDSFEDTYKHKGGRNNIKSTGYDTLDWMYDGGFGGGDLITGVAFSGVGKTNLCVNIGANFIRNHKTVLHFTFENSKEAVFRRYHSILTKIPIRKLDEKKDQVYKNLEEYRGLLHVEPNPMVKYSLDHLEAYYNMLVDGGVNPDLIIIDSPLHLKSRSRREKRNEELSDIWKECKSWGQTVDLPIFTTAQLNRSAANKSVSDASSIGDSIDIYRDSDGVLLLGRDGQDLLNGRITATNIKNRFGPDGQSFFLNWDPHTCILEEEVESTEKLRQQFIKLEASGELSHIV